MSAADILKYFDDVADTLRLVDLHPGPRLADEASAEQLAVLRRAADDLDEIATQVAAWSAAADAWERDQPADPQRYRDPYPPSIRPGVPARAMRTPEVTT